MEDALKNLIIREYGFLYRISRSQFSFGRKKQCSFELLSEFDNVSGNFEKFKGWIKVGEGSRDYEAVNYGEVVLEPLRKDSLIYHFNGTIEWTSISKDNSDLKDRLMPLSVRPIYDAKKGRIIRLKPSKFADSEIFDGAIIKYLDTLVLK